MNYKFPIIKHLNDVVPAIEGRKEFIVAERDGFTVVNYVVQTPDTFSMDDEGWEIRRECRGITFYEDGSLATRKFEKFFNVNEREETLLQNIDLSKPHVILEKLDGSMITPFLRDDKIEYHTKMGVTEVAGPVNEFTRNINAQGPWYDDFSYDLIQSKLTPIFEWTSLKQRIVISYPKDDLVLLAVRCNETGEYKSYHQMLALAEPYNIPVVKQHHATFDADFIDYVRGLIGAEGFVVRFNDGGAVKIKAEEYLKLHRAKEAISQEKNVWAMILDADVDDLKSFLSDEDRVRIEQFETALWSKVQDLINIIDDFIANANNAMLDVPGDHRQKAFAVDYVQKNLPKALHHIAFKVFNGKDTREVLLDWINKNLGTRTQLDQIRPHFDGLRFDKQEIEE